MVLDEEEAEAMMAVLGQNKLCARFCGLQCGIDSFGAADDHEYCFDDGVLAVGWTPHAGGMELEKATLISLVI